MCFPVDAFFPQSASEQSTLQNNEHLASNVANAVGVTMKHLR
jgi:hypothetical protein